MAKETLCTAPFTKTAKLKWYLNPSLQGIKTYIHRDYEGDRLLTVAHIMSSKWVARIYKGMGRDKVLEKVAVLVNLRHGIAFCESNGEMELPKGAKIPPNGHPIIEKPEKSWLFDRD